MNRRWFSKFSRKGFTIDSNRPQLAITDQQLATIGHYQPTIMFVCWSVVAIFAAGCGQFLQILANLNWFWLIMVDLINFRWLSLMVADCWTLSLAIVANWWSFVAICSWLWLMVADSQWFWTIKGDRGWICWFWLIYWPLFFSNSGWLLVNCGPIVAACGLLWPILTDSCLWNWLLPIMGDFTEFGRLHRWWQIVSPYL